MNPILLLLPIAAYFYFSQQKNEKKKAPKKPEPEGDSGPDEPELAAFSTYTDTSGITWNVTQRSATLWRGTPARLSEGTGLEPIEAPTRRDLLRAIEKATRDVRPEIVESRKAGREAGRADAEDSIKAYKDAIVKYHVEVVSKRYKDDESNPWKNGYREAFDRATDGYNLTEDGYIVAKDSVFA